MVIPAVGEKLNPLHKLEMGQTTDNKGMPVFHYSLVSYSNFYAIFLGFQLTRIFKNKSAHRVWLRTNY